METVAKNKRTFKGVVVSDKMDKTIVVRVDSIEVHPKYKKRYTQSKRFKVHDEKNEYSVGDVVRFQETRPLSRDKRWRVLEAIVTDTSKK
ncbi:MAG: 30S ribosomal protein S17 [bacterium]|nr:30S ribosomal protein S17 [bacterium]